MNFPKNFSLQELTQSDYALRNRLDNSPPSILIPELLLTAQMLQKIRDYLSANKGEPMPLIVTSGYRSDRVNKGVGGAKKSDHIFGLAADFKSLSLSPYEICKLLLPKLDELGIGQLIHELSWVHVSRKKPSDPANNVLTIDRLGTRFGISKLR